MKWLLLLLLIGPVWARPLDRWEEASQTQRLEPAKAYEASIRLALPILLKQGPVVDLDFDVPTVILPDLHAQRDYLVQALQMKRDGDTVLDQLKAGRINLLCLGDGMHSENRARQRWLQAENELAAGARSPAMEAEMVESLGLMKMVMDLKAAYPKHFYFVRGNHEDMDPLRPYRKFTSTGESELVKRWVTARFGPDFLKKWHAFEKALPLVARGATFVGSHSPPESVLSPAQMKSEEAFRACTWSDNTLWTAGSQEERSFLENCELMKVTPQRPWIAGHRKVTGSLYRSQMGGRLIQINPLDSDPRVVAVAPAKGKSFDPRRDIFVLKR